MTELFSLFYAVVSSGRLGMFQTLSVAHVVSPCVTMFVLALVHSQIMAIYETSQYSQLKANTKTKR